MKRIRFVGLYVHADTIAVAVAERDGEVRSVGVIPNRDECIRKLVKKLGPVEELHCCYSDWRRWGRKLGERGGKNAKKRAAVAVARKLAVLLHRLWVSGEVYEPLRNSQKAMRAVA